MDDLFQEAILDEARHPRNTGQLEQPDISLTEANASCGDIITVDLQFAAGSNKLEQIRWRGSGCTISQAAMSQVSELVQGKTAVEIATIGQSEIESLLGLEQISLGRVKCLLLGITAVQKAIQQYQSQEIQK
ncbi:MAG: iron-sulfur cluster assembly scaffold protein [Patescibacteria group bacterium]